MIARQATADTGLGVSFMVSTVIHLAVFLLVYWVGSHIPPMTIPETYYVDVVNLPVAAPRAGSPSQKGNDVEAPPPPMAPESPLSLPAAPQTTSKGKTAPDKSKEASVDSAFAERMAKIEQKAEAQQEEATMERLRAKLKAQGSGRAGMPAGSGKEAGSDYATYIQSRLIDAFRETISSNPGKNQEMVVRLFIDNNGKLSRRRAERSSGDRAFEISVMRAIDMASEKFPPPPNHKMFEGIYIFKPEGITQNKR